MFFDDKVDEDGRNVGFLCKLCPPTLKKRTFNRLTRIAFVQANNTNKNKKQTKHSQLKSH